MEGFRPLVPSQRAAALKATVVFASHEVESLPQCPGPLMNPGGLCGTDAKRAGYATKKS